MKISTSWEIKVFGKGPIWTRFINLFSYHVRSLFGIELVYVTIQHTQKIPWSPRIYQKEALAIGFKVMI
jgi:hypothetical protein